MTFEKWNELVTAVSIYGLDKLEFEYEGDPVDVEEVTWLAHEDAIVVLLA